MAHIHEKIDFTASVFIVHGDKVLLHMHKKLGMWLQVGGHIELDEDPNQAAIREAREEAGLDIQLGAAGGDALNTVFSARELVVPRFLNRHFFDTSHTHEHIDFVYFAKSESADAHSEEGGGAVRWFDREELLDTELDLLPDVRKYALLALQELGD